VCSSLFGFACARQKTFEVDTWDFLIDTDGNSYIDNVQWSVDLCKIGKKEQENKHDKWLEGFFVNFANLFTEYEYLDLAKGLLDQAGQFKLLYHKNFYVK